MDFHFRMPLLLLFSLPWDAISNQQIPTSLGGSHSKSITIKALLCSSGKIHHIVYSVKAPYFAFIRSIHHAVIEWQLTINTLEESEFFDGKDCIFFYFVALCNISQCLHKCLMLRNSSISS